MLHLVRFHSGEGTPKVIHWKEWEIGELELSKSEEIDFSGRKACIGWRSPEGYHPCPNFAINVQQCPTCSRRDVSRAYTVGDFSGYPQLYEEAKREEYCLYLAGFGEDIVKCGVTRRERFEERMREQGADFGAIVAVYLGPDEIYRAEEQLQARFGFANAVRMAEKIDRLSFDREKARRNFAAVVEMVRNSEVLPEFEPRVIDFSPSYPVLGSVPRQAYFIKGRIMGAKGEILLFKSAEGQVFAVNMRRKVGAFFERKE
ncbi:MAG: DUF2797 domain-containing protein [Candidatus Micrarchaeota archaeon]|nr:DUF2797 domain-containing protein [Candidatus Micrarchaeota archaeon]